MMPGPQNIKFVHLLFLVSDYTSKVHIVFT
jgi:hypothetical protein